MNGERMQVLQMLSEGKVSANEADRLLAALERDEAIGVAVEAPASRPTGQPRYLRVVVDAVEDDGPVKVNVRVPLQLLRAGVKLVSVIPPRAQDHINNAFSERGIPFDLTQIKPENLDEIVDNLRDMTIDVDKEGVDKATVRIFCE
jgi:hypothetical protein